MTGGQYRPTTSRAGISRRHFLLSSGALLGGLTQVTAAHAVGPALDATVPDATSWQVAHIDPLPSWNDGDVKQRMLGFVRDVSSPQSPSFVPQRERIAVFDNDGTLWAEKPVPFQALFAARRLDQLANDHPEWWTTQPYQAVLERDEAKMRQFSAADLGQVLAVTHANVTPAQFELVAGAFLRVVKHPRFGVRFVDLTYQPMLELLDLLNQNGFTSFICSGGGVDFIGVFSGSAYGIARENVIGSSLKYAFRDTPRGPEMRRLPEAGSFNNEDAKPENIQLHVGRTPILAASNSDGDLAMMQFTDDRQGPFLNLLIHHDDAAREYAYDTGAENVLNVARVRGWATVSMKSDFRIVFRTTTTS
jgi:hypothetical protein